jgi:hypothetical protein
MRKSPALACVTSAVLFAIASTDTPSATRMEFDGFIHSCTSTDAEIARATPGGTLHIRGAINTNVWTTNNPYIDGPESNEVVAINVNPQGDGTVTLHMTLRPQAFTGAWDVTLKLTITEAGLVGHGVGHGTNDLHGMTLKFTVAPAPSVSNPCNPEFPSYVVSGVIISP